MIKAFKLLLGLSIVLTLGACNKDPETPAVPKTGIELVAVGPILFGGVLVGDFRDAAIKVYNHGPEDQDASDFVSKLVPPFYVKSVSEPCYSGSLPSGQSCIISIRFQPTQGGSFEQEIKIGSGSAVTSGRGMMGGVITLSESAWDMGQNIAGTELRKDFTVTNEGDYAVQAPALELPPEVVVGIYTCGTFIQPHKTCRVEIVARKITAGTKTEIIKFNSGISGTQSVVLTSQTFPSEASGVIDFQSPQVVQVTADGVSEYTVRTNPIKDQFGNIVSDGTNVRLTPTNCSLLTASPQATIGGVISFTLRSSTVKGFSTVSVLSGEASGFLRAKAVSGQPSGAITVQTYASQVLADGQTQVQFKVNAMLDQFGNIVEDGTSVYYFLVRAGNPSLVGYGNLSAATGSTILGQTSLLLTSGTVVGSDVLQIRAGPVYDANNNLISYRAMGDFNISYIAGPPAGNMAIVPQSPAIYALEDSYYENLGLPIRTVVEIGPVRDTKMNMVVEGTAVQIYVTGGTNVTYTGQNPATAYTDASGKISIIVAGNGTRGLITISTTAGNGATGSGTVWAYKDEVLNFKTTGDNPITLQERLASASSLPDRSLLWSDTISYNGIASADNLIQDGFATNPIIRRNLVDTATTRVYSSNLPWIRWPAFFTNNLDLYLAPTEAGNPAYPSDPNRFKQLDGLKFFRNNGSQLTQPDLPFVLNATTTSIPVNMGYYAAVANTSNSLCDRLGDLICQKNFNKSNYPGMTYLESFDRFIMFGGYNYQIFEDLGNNPAYPSSFVNNPDNYFGVTSRHAAYFSGLIRDGATAIASANTGTENQEDIGSYPPEMGMMAMTNNGYNLAFGFGGYNSLSEQGFSRLHIYNGSSGKWSELMPEDDVNEEGNNAAPTERHQNAVAYVPELKTLYVIGGMRKYYCSDFTSALVCEQAQSAGQCKWQGNSCQAREGSEGSGWIQGPQIGGSDIWKVKLALLDTPTSPEVMRWERVCGSQKSLTSTGQSNPAYRTCNINANNWHRNPTPAPVPITPVKTLAVYNELRKKIYVYYEGKSDVYVIDPFTDTIGTANDGAQTLAPLHQVLFNKKSGKMIGYQRAGAENASTSKLTVWDSNPGEKIYHKAKIFVGAGAKTYGQQLIPKVRAFGKTTNSTIPQNLGASLYMYNFTTNQWDFVSSNTSVDISEAGVLANVLTGTYSGNPTVSRYVSTEGYVELLIAPNGQPSASGTSYLGIDQIVLEGRF